MATPLTADQMLARLKSEGVTVHEHTGWRTHERDDETGKVFGPVYGVLIHHTAGHNDLEICFNGRSDLPGPLCHSWLGKTAGLWMLSAGRSNHAGGVDGDVIAALRNEMSPLPVDDETDVDGNDCLYGLEIENLGNGTDPYPAVQYDEAVRWAAALCRAHGWSERSVAGHKEVQPGKVDPSFDMDIFRAAVAARLAHPADWNPEEDDVELTDAQIEKIAAASAKKTLTLDGVIKSDTDSVDNPYVSLATITRNAAVVGRRTEARVAALAEANSKLVDAVALLAANVGDLDPAAIVTELKAAIENITIHLDVPEA